ncbi:Two-component response regulator, YesN/AraC family, consists of REC and AraC-type DNA-binding domains [Paenibacillus catalpae]|uniref:Two-component response regulator, YesN/AraC family, consists of REC and AraC-type DNA-binding domains n=1 Tax=Paenibacillus catalpae TaxID=1045775 RepID=A0A1I2BB48_9BACL|nr:response regulator [Paenibacillus catalpae]SFE53108.1 Two-component response regulator, YesN/AraC family, consists of REC and AraC-type DNA-binding domains [Paenibacillus catalpae]
MYSVIIVDDEPWAIKGIRNAFDWSKHGFEITGQFTSVHKAFEFICEESPDLIVTDIRMPEISGLELMRMTREKGKDADFVVVSGFAEFAYAQEAIRYGALDYFLKPIDIELADSLIKKLAVHFANKRGNQNNLILEALISADKNELSRLTRFFDCFSENDYYRALILYSNRDNISSKKRFDVEHTLEIELGSRKTLYILKSGQITNLKELNFTGSDIKAAGISSISNHYKDFAKLIKESDLAASKVFLNEDEKGLFEYEQKLNIVKPFIDSISVIIQEKQFEALEDTMGRLKNDFSKNNAGMGEVVYLWNQVVSVLLASFYEELKDMELGFLNYSELKERFENFESLCSFLYDVLLYIRQLDRQSVSEGDISSYFTQMVKYIDNHYSTKLYLKDLSAKFFLNQVYCCQLFKKNLGKTFSEYVTELRINKACELLKHTAMSVEEVALKVGISDYYYFNKVFKKQCGITPAKYRKC